MELSDKKFAVLIDADNISHRKIKDILDEIANYGTPTIKRIYGDFTDPKFAAWKSILLENSITPIQQYAYTTGKNATDSARWTSCTRSRSTASASYRATATIRVWQAASANRAARCWASAKRKRPNRSSNLATNSSTSRFSDSLPLRRRHLRLHRVPLRLRHRHRQRKPHKKDIRQKASDV